ncbi:YihY/virulence factor BrkB family protein [Microbacterium rhizosphaerae]|uniref:YihY/virulence factor BrkB family protein n=1 Tax=Microbacterium rhizosphaerae TaxID=1678237 RepID=A0ABZ0SNQ8_9MICO|nr:YihY/virulence factor BrkB family protein [Microbacterium rhizosphaerae]WPR90758.1 YihY/virulence factor BrkB family protein [Microbacterium rhizosphaerae]
MTRPGVEHGAAPSSSDSAKSSRTAAAQAERDEKDLRARFEERQETLRQRFDEPIARATALTQRTLAWFPVRVWRNFLQHDGFILAAGVSYQSLFAGFAALYVVFAIAGLWLGDSVSAANELIRIINNYFPGLIAEDGVIKPHQVQEIVSANTGTLTITGVIALGTLVWTAISAISYARRAVRGVFGIPPDRRNYFWLKSLDLVAALVFGAGLFLGTVLVTFGTWALQFTFDLIGLSNSSKASLLTVRLVTVLALLIVNILLMAGLFRFLTGTQLTWRRIMPGAVLGASATTVLQLGFGLFLSFTPSNPLVATFAVAIVLLLWFRLIGIVLLVAASWIAVAAKDNHIPLLPVTEAERLAAEHQALLLAARVRLRTAQEARATAPWHRRWAADRAVREAEDELEQVEAATPAVAAATASHHGLHAQPSDEAGRH